MECRELISFLMDFLDGELPTEHAATFQHHLDVCPECVAYVDGYERAVQLAKNTFEEPDEATCDDMPEDLVQAILTAREAS